MEKTSNISEVIDSYKALLSKHPSAVFAFVCFSALGDGTTTKKVLPTDQRAKNFTAELLQNLLTAMEDGETANIKMYPAKMHRVVKEIIYTKPVELGQGAMQLKDKVAHSMQLFDKKKQRDEVHNSVTYNQMLEFFHEDLERQEKEKRLKELERENADLRLRLKSQEEQDQEIKRALKKAQYADILTGIGTHVVTGLIQNNKQKIGQIAQSLAGIPADAVVGLLGGEEQEAQSLNGTNDNNDPNSNHIMLFKQLPPEDQQHIANYAKSYVENKYTQKVESV